MSATYFEVLEAVKGYYGTGSDQWLRMVNGSATPSEIVNILKSVPGVTVTYTKSGYILGYDYSNPFTSTNPAEVIDSNVQSGFFSSGSFNSSVPSTAQVNSETGLVSMQSGAKAVSTGSKIATIADRTSLAIIGTSLGIKLGKFIDQSLYNTNPQFWDEHLPELNPETWDNIATSEGGKDFIRTLFKLENDTVTPYVDERMLAYTYQVLLQTGAFSSGGTYKYTGDTTGWFRPDIREIYVIKSFVEDGVTYTTSDDTTFIVMNAQIFEWTITTSGGVLLADGVPVAQSGYTQWTYSRQSFWTSNPRRTRPSSVDPPIFPQIYDSIPLQQAASILFEGEPQPGIEGIADDPLAQYHVTPSSVINPTTGVAVTPSDNIDDVVTALKTAYPELFENEISDVVVQPDGSTQTFYYVPAPMPDISDDTKPVTGLNRQGNPEISPQTNPQSQLDDTADTLTTPPVPPTTGIGDSPTITPADGTANALFSIYNPSQTELNSFGAWLWTNDFITQLLKLFNDPMQAIIGLHKIYAPIPVGGTDTIHVGYLDSNVPSNTVSGQYVTVNCGSVSISEFFGNVFDYEPFTRINIFLPFIGFQQLDVGEVMRSTISVKYHVDIITGACLAEVSVIRDNAGGIMYNFSGNCAVTYPVSSGSYMGIVSSVASTAISAVGTIASGGSLLPFTAGAVNNLMHAHTNVNHSGAFSGNSGAMGGKIPYLIISRPQTKVAYNSNVFIGFPSNEYHSLNERSGFIKVKECHIESIPATTDELDEIETLLKTGIIL